VRTQRGPSAAPGPGFGSYVRAGTTTSQNSVKLLSRFGCGPEIDSMVWEMSSSSLVFGRGAVVVEHGRDHDAPDVRDGTGEGLDNRLAGCWIGGGQRAWAGGLEQRELVLGQPHLSVLDDVVVVMTGMPQRSSSKVSTMWSWDRSMSFAAAGWTMARSRLGLARVSG
jgi:hypothetical protein